MSRKYRKSVGGLSTETFFEKVLKWGTVIVLTMLPLLYFPGRFASYVTSKEFFLIGAVDVLICVWVWLLVSDSRYRLSRKNLIVLAPLFLFLVSVTISGFVGVNPVASFFSTVESGTGILLMWHAFLLALVAASLVRVYKYSMFKKIAQGMLGASVVLAIMTWFTSDALWNVGSQMLNGSMGGATMGNVLLAAAYFIFSLFFAVILFTQESSRVKKVWYAIGIAIIIFCPVFFLAPDIWMGNVPVSQIKHSILLLIGHARMATVSIVFGVALSVFTWFALASRKKMMTWVGVVGAIIVIVIVGLGIQQSVSVHGKFHSFFVQEAEGRPILWDTALQGVHEKPVLGWGTENFVVEYLQHLNPVMFNPSNHYEIYAFHPHNEALEILLNDGIIGFVLYTIAFIVLIYQIIWLGRKGVMPAAMVALLCGMIFAYVLQNQMVFDLVTSIVMLFMVFGLVAAYSDFSPTANTVSEINWKGCLVTGVVIVAMIPVWLFASYLPARKSIEINRVIAMPSNERVNYYHHLFTGGAGYFFLSDAGNYTLEFAGSYNAQRDYFTAHPDDAAIANKEVGVVIDEINGVWNKCPTDYRLALSALELENLQVFLTKKASVTQQQDAVKFFTRATKLSPTDPQTYLMYSETMQDIQNISAARALIQKAVSLNTQNQEALDYQKSFNQYFPEIH